MCREVLEQYIDIYRSNYKQTKHFIIIQAMQVVQFIDTYNDQKSHTNFIIFFEKNRLYYSHHIIVALWILLSHAEKILHANKSHSLDVVPCKACWFVLLPFKDGMGCFGYCLCMRNLLAVAAGTGFRRIV